MDDSALNAYMQLLQDIIYGTVRRHTFTPVELHLLLDVQGLGLRKTAQNEILRRYMRALQQQSAAGISAPPRLAQFCEKERYRGGLQPVQAHERAPAMITASSG